MDNKSNYELQELINKDAELEPRLFDKDNKPKVQQIIDFLDKLHNLAQSTYKSNDFEVALTLFDKWNVNLLNFYDYKNYMKHVSRSASDFSDAVRFPSYYKELNPKRIKEDLQKYRQYLRTGKEPGKLERQSDDSTTQDQAIDASQTYDISEEEKANLRKFFR